MTHVGVQGSKASAEEAELVARLRTGDEQACEALVVRHYATMLAAQRAARCGWRCARSPSCRQPSTW